MRTPLRDETSEDKDDGERILPEQTSVMPFCVG